ncbi:MAG: molybdopterin-dependent oxidoreductase, partial [Acidimicrobiia bacterium]
PQPMSQTDRRAFLGAAGAVTAGAVVSAAAGRALVGSRMESVRNRYALPPAAQPVTPPPPGASFSHQGLAPLIVPNDEFYRIDTRLVGAPRIDIDRWRLRITGMVEEPFSLTFEELLAMPLVEEHVTLSCVSNEVGGDLVGTAAWRGVRLDGLLERAGVQPGATQLVGRAVDGFTVGFPTEAALDGRDALVAVGMNGELLPLIHGFPARLVVPGLYGYVSATKWLSEIELTRWEGFDAYWIPRGWDKRAPVLTQSRIDTVVPRTPTAGQPAVVAGVAWAPTRGVSRVEVNIDGDGWREAELAAPLTDDTWRQWRYRWEPTAGQHVVAVRATDGRGDTQTSERTPPGPNGATGYHTIRVDVAEGHGGRGEQAG